MDPRAFEPIGTHALAERHAFYGDVAVEKVCAETAHGESCFAETRLRGSGRPDASAQAECRLWVCPERVFEALRASARSRGLGEQARSEREGLIRPEHEIAGPVAG